jgi:hypothetical protein
MSLMWQQLLCSTVIFCLSATACHVEAFEDSPSSHKSTAFTATAQAVGATTVSQDVVGMQPTGESLCNGSYYFVSTVRCPQAPGRGCVGEFHVEHICACGRVQRASIQSMLEALQPGVPVSIGVHGSFLKEREVRSLTTQRFRRVRSSGGNRPFHFIAFHWPSDIGIPYCPTIQTNKLGKRAGFNGVYLAQLIGMIPGTNPVCLAGHSHGTRVASSALHLLAGGSVDGYCVPDNCPSRRMRAVFGAAAIDSHWLSPGQKYGLALNRVECLLNLRTRHDIALTVYPLQDPLLHHALGKTGFQSRQLKRMGNNRNKIREFDVTRYVGYHHDVAAYYPHDAIWRSMAPYVHFD